MCIGLLFKISCIQKEETRSPEQIKTNSSRIKWQKEMAETIVFFALEGKPIIYLKMPYLL